MDDLDGRGGGDLSLRLLHHGGVPPPQPRRRQMLVIAASCLLLFGAVIELTEVLYDRGRVTYLIFGAVCIVLGAGGLLWARLDRRRLDSPVPLAEAE